MLLLGNLTLKEDWGLLTFSKFWYIEKVLMSILFSGMPVDKFRYKKVSLIVISSPEVMFLIFTLSKATTVVVLFSLAPLGLARLFREAFQIRLVPIVKVCISTLLKWWQLE